MKSGASDPFADDLPATDETSTADDTADERPEDGSDSPPADRTDGAESRTDDVTDSAESGNGSGDPTTDAGGSTSDGDAETDGASSAPGEPSETDSGPTISKADLPLLLRRETVKAERENVHQLFVQADTDTLARQAENELSERLDTDVYRLDAREAIYLAGMRNLADAEAILEEWGYNF